jgi:hypothetical protein
MTRFKKLFNYFDSPGDVLLFFQIFLFLTVLPLLLKLLTLKKLMEVLSSESNKNNNSTSTEADNILQLTNLILHRNFFIYRNICLKRSLTLYYFLSRMGQRVNIYYGIKKDADVNNEHAALDGHSWIELNGEIFNGGDKGAPDIYHITYSYPN